MLHRPEEALQTYKQLLTYTKSAVTRNYSEKSINNILDYVGGGKGGTVEVDILERFYEATRNALREQKNERLSVKTNLKLAKLWLDKREYQRLQKVIQVFMIQVPTEPYYSFLHIYKHQHNRAVTRINQQKEHSCRRSTLSKSRCTTKQRTTRSLRRSTTPLLKLLRQFLTQEWSALSKSAEERCGCERVSLMPCFDIILRYLHRAMGTCFRGLFQLLPQL